MNIFLLTQGDINWIILGSVIGGLLILLIITTIVSVLLCKKFYKKLNDEYKNNILNYEIERINFTETIVNKYHSFDSNFTKEFDETIKTIKENYEFDDIKRRAYSKNVNSLILKFLKKYHDEKGYELTDEELNKVITYTDDDNVVYSKYNKYVLYYDSFLKMMFVSMFLKKYPHLDSL